MLDKSLLKNDRWQVTIGMLGFGSIKVQNDRGQLHTATDAEKLFILDTLVTLDRKHLPLGIFLPVRYNIISDFAAGIFEQRGGSAWPMVYQIAFRGAPGSQVDSYIAAYLNAQ